MAAPHAHTRPADRPAAPSAAVPVERGVGPALVLAATLAVGVFAGLTALGLLLVQPDPRIITTRFGPQQNQSVKTALYLLGFGLVVPLAGIAGTRLADAIAAGPNGRALGGLTAALVLALSSVLVLVRLSALLPWGDGLAPVLAGVALWAVVAAGVLARAARGGPWNALQPLAGRGEPLGLAAAAGTWTTVLCFTNLSRTDGVVLVLGTAAIGAGVALRHRLALTRVSGRWGAALDLAAIALVLVTVPNLVVYTASGALPNLFFPPGIIQFHHDFLLGPTNQVLHGGTLLVDSPVSQYGVGSVYFLAAWFEIAPISYGTYGLLDGLMTAGFFAAGYAVLRVAGTPRLLASAALAVAVVTLVLALAYPVGALPQQGPLRFGLPMALVLATAVGLRRPAWERAAGLAAFAVVGLSSVWALEAFVYTGVTLAAMLVVRAWLQPPGAQVRWLVRQLGGALAACAIAHVLLALATLAVSGSLPDWGQYLAYLEVFLAGGEAGKLTYGFEPWSPALPLGAGLTASAFAVTLVVRRRPTLATDHALELVTLAGLTAYGVAMLSYTQNRSSTYLLPYVALPALLAGVVWVSLLLRTPRAAPRSVRLGALASVLAAGLLLLVSASRVGDGFARTPLAHAYPGGGLRAAVARLWDPPPIDPRAPAGVELLDRWLPGQDRVLILMPNAPELSVEILMRADRGNALPVGNPVEEGFVPDEWAPRLSRAVAGLRGGERILLTQATLDGLAELRRRPGANPLEDPQIGTDPLGEWIGLELLRRFELRVLARGDAGLVVARLDPR